MDGKWRRLIGWSTLLLAVSGCEFQTNGITMNVPPKSLKQPVPSPDYHLDADERAKVPPGFDVDALERLLARVIPERRAEILGYFQIPEDPSQRRGMLMHVNDPELQRLLDEVWAPMWDYSGATDEDIEKNTFAFPGRDIARSRRAAARLHDKGNR